MSHPVQQRVAAIVRRVRRLRAMHALGLWLICCMVIVFLLGFADFCFRFEDPGLRYLSTGFVVLVLGGLAWRVVYPGLAYYPSNLETAQRIEQFFPRLNDRLSSSIAFMGQSEDESKGGSTDLRRAVVAGMAAELDDLDFSRCLDTKAPRRIAGLSIAVCLLVTVICIWQWPSAALATRRLVMPWKEQPWPRRNQLEFVQPPSRLAIGSDFEVELIDRNGNLPSSVQIYCWFDGDDQADAQQNEMKYSDDRMVHRLENVTRSLKYRAVGGDDDTMEWISLEVVEPPRVESLAIRLHPPDYTAWPLEQSGGNIHAMVGTVVELTGRLSEPASAIMLYVDGQELSPSVPIQVSADGLEFRINADVKPPWTVSESGEYGFHVTDRAGLSGEGDARWTIRAIPDESPIVSLERPSANSFVTPNALVTLNGVVRDDLAVQSILIRYHRSDAGDELEPQTVPIFEGPNRPQVVAGQASLSAASEHVQSVDFDWDLSQLPGLEPGLWVDFEIVAEDYRPQSGRSTSRRLTIISVSELEERVSARRSFVLGQLAEVLRMQREVRAEIASLDIVREELGRFRQQAVDRLQSAELRQRQVGELLSGSTDGVEAQITTLLDELRGNRIDSPEVYERMAELLAAVREISRELLPEIQRELIAASKSARESLHAVDGGAPPAVEASLATSLNSAGEQQDAVIAALEALLGDFSQWDSYHRFSRELTRLRQAQGEVRQDTERMRLETLAKDLDELTPEQRSELRRIGLRQTELAHQFVRIQSRMEQMQADLVQDDPAAAETLADALSLARRAAISGQMRDSGRRIDDHRLGPATEIQQEILQNLQDLINTLVNRREHELERRVDKLTAAEAELGELRRRQKELNKKLEQAAAEDDPQRRRDELDKLQASQQQQAEQANQLSRRLERLSAQRAAEALRRAASELEQSATAAQQGSSGGALEQAEKAERSLEEAEELLREEKRRAEQDLATEQMTKLGQLIGDLARRQDSVANSTTEFDRLRQEQGRLTRAQSISVGRLAREQRALATDAGSLAEQVGAAEAFVFGLQGVMREMDRAARGLERADTGPSTQRAQQKALSRLAQLLEALERDESSDDEQPSDGENEENDGGGQSMAEALQRLAELKLLRLMQQDINRQTAALEEQRQRDGELSDAQLDVLNELSQEQGRLAELILDFSQ